MKKKLIELPDDDLLRLCNLEIDKLIVKLKDNNERIKKLNKKIGKIKRKGKVS